VSPLEPMAISGLTATASPLFRPSCRRLGGSSTSLTLVTWFDTMAPGSLQGLVLQSEDLDADYSALLDRGVRFESPPTQQPWGREAVIVDPDGNKLVLQQRS
jgi:hypothetical protein